MYRKVSDTCEVLQSRPHDGPKAILTSLHEYCINGRKPMEVDLVRLSSSSTSLNVDVVLYPVRTHKACTLKFHLILP